MNKNKLKILYLLKLKQKQQKRRSIYIRDIFLKRNFDGELNLVKDLAQDSFYHFRYFRMNKDTFDELMTMTEKDLIHSPNHKRPISPVERLSLTLRYLATGNSQVSLALNYRVSPSSLVTILRETMEIICNKLEEKYLPIPDQNTWIKNAQGFKKYWNFPSAVGAIDGKHVRVKAPQHSGSSYFNYKSYFSYVLLAVVDYKYCFSAVDIGASGSYSDAGILRDSNLGKRLESGDLISGYEEINNIQYPYVILGDEGFPLKNYLLRPFSKKSKRENEENVFNYRLSRARMVSENAFGILAARFRIFHTPINGNEDLVKLIIKTSVILHNFLMKKNDLNNFFLDKEDNNGEIIRGNWHEEADRVLTDLGNQGSNFSSKSAHELRENLKNYFMTPEGSLSWQDNYVKRGYI